MINKHHDLETYYLNRRLELLSTLDQFANEAFENEYFTMDDGHWKLEMLKREYSDVIVPESLCSTLRKIYPESLFKIESRETKQK